MSLTKFSPSAYRMLYNFLLDFQLLAIFSSIPTTKLCKPAILVTVIFSRNRSWKETAPKCLLDDDDVEVNVLTCRVDILGTNCDQCVCMVQCCFTSTETIRLIRTGSPGRPPRLSHSSWTLRNAYLLGVVANFKHWFTTSFFLGGRCLKAMLGVWGCGPVSRTWSHQDEQTVPQVNTHSNFFSCLVLHSILVNKFSQNTSRTREIIPEWSLICIQFHLPSFSSSILLVRLTGR